MLKSIRVVFVNTATLAVIVVAAAVKPPKIMDVEFEPMLGINEVTAVAKVPK